MKQSKEDQALILLSIAHWERMRDGATNERPYNMDCPLCQEYYSEGCRGCPIQKKTGQANCKGTPWGNGRNEWCIWGEKGFPKNSSDWEAAAQAEIDFLKSLLD